MRAQVEAGGHRLRREQLLHTLPDPIEMETAIRERLLNGRLDERRRMLLMQLQDAHKFAHPTSFRPLLAQALQQTLVARRPSTAPALERFRVVKGARALHQEREVM